MNVNFSKLFKKKLNTFLINFGVVDILNTFTDIAVLMEILSISIFIAGLTLICFNLSNLIITLIGVELLLLAANINFLTASLYNNDGLGFVFALCILTISAAETAIGAGLLIVCFSVRRTVEFSDLNTLKD